MDKSVLEPRPVAPGESPLAQAVPGGRVTAASTVAFAQACGPDRLHTPVANAGPIARDFFDETQFVQPPCTDRATRRDI